MSRKKCYYEIMGLTMDASDEDIKKSYRQLALALHPDKNAGNLEFSDNQFKLLQEAYDVLSDPRERKWYDKHKDSILCGRNRDDIIDKEIDVLPYFTSYCYNSFTDEENGFYSVYRNLFNSLIQEDIPYRDYDLKETEIAPDFGDSKISYSSVHMFYSYWMSYCTPKTYSYLDKYNINDAPNRRIARIIEKENKKIRDSAKKKRNEEIRHLVEFVRKRDRRVLENKKKLEAKNEANKKKSELIRRQHIEARNKELENYKESEWTSMAALEEGLKQIEEHLDSNEEKKQSKTAENTGNSDEEEDNLYCIACDKAFKSDKAFANHENSKKHKTNVSFLKQELENEFNEAVS